MIRELIIDARFVMQVTILSAKVLHCYSVRFRLSRGVGLVEHQHSAAVFEILRPLC